jgi:hypothetical protein
MTSDDYPYDPDDDDGDDDLAVCQRRFELLRRQVRSLTRRMQAIENNRQRAPSLRTYLMRNGQGVKQRNNPS